jgi:23S rRNA pseudouridine1911/1915/1917 synthase
MSQVYKFKSEKEHDSMKVEDFLARHLTSLSRTHIANLIERGSCYLNKEPATLRQRIKEGDEILIQIQTIPHNSATPENIPLGIVFEDESLLVVVKPSGMLVHPTLNVKSGTLLNALSYHLNKTQNTIFIRPGLVHRLDRETSGLIIIAKTQKSLSHFGNHFQRKLVKKTYLALVDGIVSDDELTVIAPIGRDENQKPKWCVLESGKHAETRLRVLARYQSSSFVELEPITGRTNQLRIHCAHIGHSIIGDKLHGKIEFERLCLHAAKISFYHPVTNEWLEFESPLPKEFKSAMNKFS